ncbi:MAG TPA: murein biosynthesis integral membrane protein MurJ [Terriglobia bacterium]|nr:murein biosynthesis integral membrane protein MurJ [Terriglobia bacterium]
MALSPVTRRIAQSSGIVMTGVLASRILGFFREWAVAHQVGSNAVTDAYYAAFTLPDFLNYLVAGGALSLTFIPVFSKYVAENLEEEGWKAFSTVITSMAVVLVVLVVLGEIFAPQLVSLIAPGFDPEQKARVIFLTRLMLPAQICFYLGSILSAVQYAKGQFVIPSAASVIYNLAIIVCGVTLSSRIGITGFAVGVLAGALVGNLLLQIYGASRVGARFRPNLNLGHPGFRMFVKLTLPIMLALSLVFTDDWIIRWFGSYLEAASITWLSYAKTLMRVPLGVVGQAIGVASFPFLAQLYSEGKLDELNRTLNSTLKGVILLLVPISALTMALSSPLVHFVFSRTRLQEPDLEATAATLVFFSIGMIGWGLQNILARGFYAVRDTLTPAVVGTAFTFLNLPLYWWLAHHMRHLGLALASSCGIIAYTIALFVILNRRLRNPEALGLVGFFAKVSVASAAGALVAFGLVTWLGIRIGWHTTWRAFLILVVASVVGLVLTVMFVKVFRVREVESYLERIQL